MKLTDEVLSHLVAVARETAVHHVDPEPGDLIVATLGCPRPGGRLDPDAIGYLVYHGQAPLHADGTGECREVWDVRALSGSAQRDRACLRWENVDFAPVSGRVVWLIDALLALPDR